MRFAMTIDGWVKGITAFTVLTLAVTFPLAAAAVGQPGVPAPAAHLTHLGLVLVGLVLLISLLGAPKAVRVMHDGLVIERRGLGDYPVPFSEISAVREGPPIVFGARGQVRRVAGNGGFFGFTGLFAVEGVGTVRCWATRLNTPTVLVERRDARPVLLGVDQPERLLSAIRAAMPRGRTPRLY